MTINKFCVTLKKSYYKGAFKLMKIKKLLFCRFRIIDFCLAILITISCSGCNEMNEKNYSAISPILNNIPRKAVHIKQYDSPYTIGYRNPDDTYTLYTFASPIQFRTNDGYKIIDNSIIISERDGYLYENKSNNIKTYFPQKISDYFLVEYNHIFIKFKPCFDTSGFSDAKVKTLKNMFGDYVNSAVYESKNVDLIFYPVKSGIRLEVLIKSKEANSLYEFEVITSAKHYEDKKNGYILFKNKTDCEGVIYTPVVESYANNEDNINVNDLNNQAQITQISDGIYKLSINHDFQVSGKTQYPLSFDTSFELYLNKIPDSTVYSETDYNMYLKQYVVAGTHPLWGEGIHYIRLRLQNIIGTDSTKIIKAYYGLKVLYTSGAPTVMLSRCNQQWSSMQMVWDSHPLVGNEITKLEKQVEGYNQIDITSFVKDCYEDPDMLMESTGMILTAEGGYIVCASSDHSLYPSYFTLQLTSQPSYFIEKQNINDN